MNKKTELTPTVKGLMQIIPQLKWEEYVMYNLTGHLSKTFYAVASKGHQGFGFTDTFAIYKMGKSDYDNQCIMRLFPEGGATELVNLAYIIFNHAHNKDKEALEQIINKLKTL